MQATTLMEHAIALAERGWAVFPLVPVGKLPLRRGGYKLATSDVAAVRRAWRLRSGACNIGVAMGPRSGVLGIDIDVSKGGLETIRALAAKFGPLPRTFRVRTRNGWHLYFLYPKDRRITIDSNVPGPGLDYRGDGGHLVGPGSIHPIGGFVYVIDRDVPLVELPAWYLDLITKPEEDDSAPVVADGAEALDMARRAPSDEEKRKSLLAYAKARLQEAHDDRNKLLNRWAFTLSGAGFSHAEVSAELWPAVQGWIGHPAEDPFTRKEFAKTVRSAARAGVRRPLPSLPGAPRSRDARKARND